MDMEANGSPDSEEVHQLEQQHRHYSAQLEALLQKPYPSEQEQLEEVRLKKLKLYVKDQLVARRSSHGAYVA
ncbi:MAG TPA: YdcH family protein [Silvibacterium sp.]|nr:YdcH family protein [Silvibacterium sp.]